MNLTWRSCGPMTLAGLIVGLAPAAAAEGPCGPFAFRDAAAEAGVDFRHQTGAAGEKHLPETMGAGAAWLDYDGDGWLDLYLVQSGAFPPSGRGDAGNVLFRNEGGGQFARVLGRGAGHRGYGQGVLAADFDGDGDQDLYVANYGEDAYLVNDGGGGFSDRTAGAGLGAPGWSSSAAAADFDGDGDLDLYVTRYLVFDPEEEIFCGDPDSGLRKYCDPAMFRGQSDVFYLNEEGRGLAEATGEVGIGPADGRGLGVVFTDLDGDSLPDLYVANDLDFNFLFANRGDGAFEDVSLLSGAALNRDGRPEAGMGIALGDVDGDLDPDLLVTNFDVETNTLYRNDGGHVFSDESGPSGFGIPSFNRLAFGVVAADLDRDGRLDVYVANGHIFERPERQNVVYRQPDQLLAGDGAGSFTAVPCAPLDDRPTVARGLAAGDYDNDGDLDLVVQESGGPARLLANGAADGRWLGVRLRGRAPNTDAVGARLALRTGGGRQLRWVTAGDSYQSSSDRRVLFGMGDAAEDLEVWWPGGRRSRLLRPPAGRYLVLTEPGS